MKKIDWISTKCQVFLKLKIPGFEWSEELFFSDPKDIKKYQNSVPLQDLQGLKDGNVDIFMTF